MYRKQFGAVKTITAVAGDTVADNTPTLVGSIQENVGRADQLLLYVDYTKGDEAGVWLTCCFPTNVNDTDMYQDGWYRDLATGVLDFLQHKYRLTASGVYRIPFDLRNDTSFAIYQTSTAAIVGVGGTLIIKQKLLG